MEVNKKYSVAKISKILKKIKKEDKEKFNLIYLATENITQTKKRNVV